MTNPPIPPTRHDQPSYTSYKTRPTLLYLLHDMTNPPKGHDLFYKTCPPPPPPPPPPYQAQRRLSIPSAATRTFNWPAGTHLYTRCVSELQVYTQQSQHLDMEERRERLKPAICKTLCILKQIQTCTKVKGRRNKTTPPPHPPQNKTKQKTTKTL